MSEQEQAAINKPHPLAGQTVKLKSKTPELNGREFHVEDWWHRVSGGKSWMDCDGNPACMMYGMRSGLNSLPLNERVLYGKVAHLGYIVHETEIEALEAARAS